MKTKITSSTVKFLLKADLTVQITLMLSAVALLLFPRPDNFWAFFVGYFILGGWQITSFLCHINRRIKNETGLHKKYAITVLVLLIFGTGSYILLLFNSFVILFYLYLMLLAGPILAIIYLMITIKDLASCEFPHKTMFNS